MPHREKPPKILTFKIVRILDFAKNSRTKCRHLDESVDLPRQNHQFKFCKEAEFSLSRMLSTFLAWSGRFQYAVSLSLLATVLSTDFEHVQGPAHTGTISYRSVPKSGTEEVLCSHGYGKNQVDRSENRSRNWAVPKSEPEIGTVRYRTISFSCGPV